MDGNENRKKNPGLELRPTNPPAGTDTCNLEAVQMFP
jgi:hypothetical protein